MSIPKVIHYCWFGRGEMPERDRKCIESWKKYCPDYEIIQWNEDNYDITKVQYMKDAYSLGRWGFVPDYARMDIVYNHGGIYLDTDVELIRPLDSLLSYEAFMGLEADTNYIALGLGFGAEKGCQLLRELCEYYKTLSFIDSGGEPNLTPAPKITTDYLSQRINTFDKASAMKKIDNVMILPPEYLCPMGYLSSKCKITEKTISIHHYHASWQTSEEKKALEEYQKFTRLLGERYGELVYQFYKAIREEGIAHAVKKTVGFLRK